MNAIALIQEQNIAETWDCNAVTSPSIEGLKALPCTCRFKPSNLQTHSRATNATDAANIEKQLDGETLTRQSVNIARDAHRTR